MTPASLAVIISTFTIVSSCQFVPSVISAAATSSRWMNFDLYSRQPHHKEYRRYGDRSLSVLVNSQDYSCRKLVRVLRLKLLDCLILTIADDTSDASVIVSRPKLKTLRDLADDDTVDKIIASGNPGLRLELWRASMTIFAGMTNVVQQFRDLRMALWALQ